LELSKLYEESFYTLGFAADKIRREKHQNKTFFNVNRHINPTNICEDICKFCAFSSHRKNPNPYKLDKNEILDQIKASSALGIKEVHIVSAHNSEYDLEFYGDLFSTIKTQFPDIHLKALTAAEVDFLSRISGKDYEYILKTMSESGVDSMPGGGAEIFDEEVRKVICKGKVSSENWLKIHKIWHKMGKKSNATMLFGHIESREHRIDHINRIKNLQEESGGFNAFIPLLYQKDNNFLNVTKFATGQEILKTIAISRILLENIPHIKAYWPTLTINLALVAQEFGADDMDGTIIKESIQSAAGAKSAKGITQEEMVEYIKESGFRAIERDSVYNEIKEH